MAFTWFRMYAEFASDPKVQSLSEVDQRRLVMIFCLRCGNVLETLHETEIAFALRITPDELQNTKIGLINKGIIDDGWNVKNWDKRQFASDSSTSRVQKYRSQLRNVSETLPKRHVTLPDTDTDSDTEQKQIKKKNKNKDFVLPGWISRKAFDSFVDMRKKIKKPLTDDAIQLLIGKLERFRAQGYDPNAILDTSTFNSWQGVFQPKEPPLIKSGEPEPLSVQQKIQQAKKAAIG